MLDAVKRNSVEVVSVLLRHGASVNRAHARSGATPASAARWKTATESSADTAAGGRRRRDNAAAITAAAAAAGNRAHSPYLPTPPGRRLRQPIRRAAHASRDAARHRRRRRRSGPCDLPALPTLASPHDDRRRRRRLHARKGRGVGGGGVGGGDTSTARGCFAAAASPDAAARAHARDTRAARSRPWPAPGHPPRLRGVGNVAEVVRRDADNVGRRKGPVSRPSGAARPF